MTPTPGEENPYQPPKAEIVVSNHSAGRAAKPASSWILMAVFALGAAAWWSKQQVYRNEFGVSTVGLNADSLAAMFCVVGLVALLLGSCQRWAYKLIVTILVVDVGRILVDLFCAAPQDIPPVALLIVIPAMALRLWLFHRFTFGLPSRRYYGMIRDESPPASETRSSES